jgi:hypothetical protein
MKVVYNKFKQVVTQISCVRCSMLGQINTSSNWLAVKYFFPCTVSKVLKIKSPRDSCLVQAFLLLPHMAEMMNAMSSQGRTLESVPLALYISTKLLE